MGYIEGQDRNQIILFPESIDDYISGSNPVRLIDVYVDQLDLEKLLSDRLFVSNLDKINCRENKKKKAGTYDLHKLKFRIA